MGNHWRECECKDNEECKVLDHRHETKIGFRQEGEEMGQKRSGETASQVQGQNTMTSEWKASEKQETGEEKKHSQPHGHCGSSDSAKVSLTSDVCMSTKDPKVLVDRSSTKVLNESDAFVSTKDSKVTNGDRAEVKLTPRKTDVSARPRHCGSSSVASVLACCHVGHGSVEDGQRGVTPPDGGEAWRNSSTVVESNPAAPSCSGTGGNRWPPDQSQGNQPSSRDRDHDQQDESEEGTPSRLCGHESGSDFDRQRNHRYAEGQGHGGCVPAVCSSSNRPCGLRGPFGEDLSGSVDGGSRLLSMGGDHRQRGASIAPSSSSGSVDPVSRPGHDQENQRIEQRCEEVQHLQGIPEEQDQSGDREPDSIETGRYGGSSLSPGEGLEGGERCPPQDQCLRGRDFFERMGAHVPVESPTPECHMNQTWDLDAKTRILDVSLARSLDFQAERLMPDAFQSLVGHQRPMLFEIACGPDSLLTKKMQQLTRNPNSAKRLSFWNGYDMTTSVGVRAVIKKIDEELPEHVWLSLECGPFSKMQNVNQRTAVQREQLQNKRANCIRQYIGGLLVYMHCFQKGIPVTWEWSETNDAWRLPMVQRVFQKYPPGFCVTKGCRVDLRDPKSKGLLQKGWKLATTHEDMCRRMELPRRCDRPHIACEGNLTRMTAYYTDKMAKRVCSIILDGISNEGLWNELSGHSGIPRSRMPKAVTCSCNEVQHPRSPLKCNCCETQEEKENPLGMVGDEQMVPVEPLTEEEKAKALKNISIIHRNTGHGPVSHLVRALEARNTDPRIVELAKTFKCDICQETSRQVPRPRVSLEPLAPKWKVVQIDNAHWIHPVALERCEFTIMVDEGRRFKIGKIMSHGSKSSVKGSDLIKFFLENWKPIFGKPDKVRADPAGPWRSFELASFFDSQQVELDHVPAEAHWGISHVERAVQSVKHMMSCLVKENPEITAGEALSEALRVSNEREVVRGYSPSQHALGRAPDAGGRFHDSELLEVPPVLVENGDGEFRRNIERMRCAEQAFSEWTANERLKRAQNTRTYIPKNFVPGDLVYVWRFQGKTRGPASSARTGGFTGPARVLAVETRQAEDGTYRPGSSVRLIRGSRLIKAAPQQLRRASVREECMEELANPPSLPWTFTRLAEDIGERQFDDVTEEVPDEMEYEQGVDEEVLRPNKRLRWKQPDPDYVPPGPPVPMVPFSQIDDEVGQGHDSHQSCGVMDDQQFGDDHARAFWTHEESAVEISFEIPESSRGKKYMANNFEAFLVANLKRRAVEVSERSMNDEERALMREAKHEEVKKFIAAKALEALPKHLQPDQSTAMKMRWVLTWKREEENGETTGKRKAKARCVILGFMDPNYEHRQVSSPTMSRTTRQLLLAISASLGFSVDKGDVSGAFLQGREYQGEAFVIPTEEICDAMQIPSGSVTKLRKACYGLVDAPLEWFLTVSEFLESIGFIRCVCDPCCFKYVKDGKLIGLVGGHVDDFLFCGLESCDLWKSLCDKIKRKFKWGTWERDNFIQCGVEIKRTNGGGFALSQTQYIDDLKEISISAERRRQGKSVTTDNEKSKLRAALGALSWCAQQSCPHIAAGVSLLLSQVTCSTVDTMIETNKLIYKVKCQRKHEMLIHGGIALDDIVVAGWADAAVQNRVDGKSTQGIFIGLSPKRLLAGHLCPVSPMAWSSAKISRQCRSPGAAECLAAINCEDLMYAVRLQFFEMCGNKVDVRRTESQVATVPGVLITDSTNVHDRMQSLVYVPKGPENRVALEMLGLKEALVNTKLPIRWVNSDAQLANSLTKDHEQHQIQRFYHLNQMWKIVEDPRMLSAKNRKKQGLDPLDESTGVPPGLAHTESGCQFSLSGPGDENS